MIETDLQIHQEARHGCLKYAERRGDCVCIAQNLAARNMVHLVM